MSPSRRVHTVAEYGTLIALAMVLSYLESLIPAFFAVPGMKLGLTNTVVLFALYTRGKGSALIINLIRIMLVSLLFSNGVSMYYSIAGGLLSFAVMIMMKRSFGIITVSVCGGIAHNIGQILAAVILLQTASIAWYLAVLWFTGLLSGALIGIIGGELVRRIAAYRNRS